MKTFIKLFLAGMLLSALLFSYPANSSAAPDSAVGVVVYPGNVIVQVPKNDDANPDSGPSYRAANPSESNAPFVLVVKVVGYYGSGTNQIRLWLVDDQGGSTVETYNRFAGGATKSLGGSLWLSESAVAADVAGTTITSNTFYVMVIGRATNAATPGNLTYTVNWQIDSGGSLVDSGTVAAGGTSTVVAANSGDWYLNWNDIDPESGDPVSSAGYVELFDSSLNSVTTAPVDGRGYFEMVLPVCANGSYSAEARSESGAIKRTWVTTTSGSIGCGDLIEAGSGEPTAVRLADFKANTAQSSMLLAFALLGLLALGGTSLFLAAHTAEIRRKRE